MCDRYSCHLSSLSKEKSVFDFFMKKNISFHEDKYFLFTIKNISSHESKFGNEAFCGVELWIK